MSFTKGPLTARRLFRSSLSAVAAAACLAGLGVTGAAQAADTGKIGLGLPLLTSPFWQSYNNYLPKIAKERASTSSRRSIRTAIPSSRSPT